MIMGTLSTAKKNPCQDAVHEELEETQSLLKAQSSISRQYSMICSVYGMVLPRKSLETRFV